MGLNIGDSGTNITVLKDPFASSKITSIDMSYDKVMFEKYWSWEATIRFKNGDTTGSQRFEVTDKESDNGFEVITKQIQAFVDSLK